MIVVLTRGLILRDRRRTKTILACQNMQWTLVLPRGILLDVMAPQMFTLGHKSFSVIRKSAMSAPK